MIRFPYTTLDGISWLDTQIWNDSGRRVPRIPFVAPITFTGLLVALRLLSQESVPFAAGGAALCAALTLALKDLRMRAKAVYLIWRFYPDPAPGCWSITPSKKVRSISIALVFVAAAAASAVVGFSAGLLLGATFGVLSPTFLFVAHLPEFVLAQRFDVAVDARFLAPGAELWERTTDRLRSSTEDVVDGTGTYREAEHLYLGSSDADIPLLLHADDLEGHLWTVGSTGGGKTSQVLLPLALQLIRGPLDESDLQESSPSMVVLDLKGDRSLFHSLRAEAERNEQTFRFFSLQGGSWFNPLRQFGASPGERASLVSFLMDALGQFHGQGYGRSFFAGESQLVLDRALELPDSLTEFSSLYAAVREKTPKNQNLEIVSTLHRLAGYSQLVTGENHLELDLRKTLLEGELAYFFLDPADGTTAAIDVARLALHGVLEAAIQRKRRGEKTRPVYVIIDEFQKIAGGDEIGSLLAQGREYGIRFILANQSMEDLRKPGNNLIPVVQTNTAVKCLFSVDDAVSSKELSLLSGEHVDRLYSSGSDGMTGWYEVIRPNLSSEMIRSVSADRGWFLLHGRGLRGHGLGWNGVMTVARAMYPITKEEFLERKDKPLPLATPATTTPERSRAQWYSPRQQPVPQTFSEPVWRPRIEELTRRLRAEAVCS